MVKASKMKSFKSLAEDCPKKKKEHSEKKEQCEKDCPCVKNCSDIPNVVVDIQVGTAVIQLASIYGSNHYSFFVDAQNDVDYSIGYIQYFDSTIGFPSVFTVNVERVRDKIQVFLSSTEFSILSAKGYLSSATMIGPINKFTFLVGTTITLFD